MSRESDDDQEYRRSGRRTDDGREHRSSGRRTDDGREYRSSGRRGDDDREYRSSGRRADDGREYRRTGRGTDDDREYRSSGRRQNDEMRRSRSGKRANRKKRKKTALTILILAIAVLAAIAIIFFLFLEGTLNSIKRVDKSNEAYVARSDETFEVDSSAGSDTMNADDVNFNAGNIDVMDSDDVKNILLIGQDKRSNQKTRTRSDTMIIASINTKTNKITMVSLMRDMYVPIPGYSANRINAAYVFGGMSLLDQVIKEDFGISIDGNVVVDFDGFLETMTKIGDLDIELTEDEANYMNANEGLGSAEDNASVSKAWGLTAGVNSLTPEQALTYSRMRYVGNSDWERTERQRKLLTAVFKKAKKSSVTKILSMVSDLIPYFETDLSNKEILKYVKTVLSGDIKLNSKSYRIPVDGGYTSQTISGMSVLVPDLEINSAYLQHYLYNKKISESLREAAKKAEVSTSSDTTTPSGSGSSGNTTDGGSTYSYNTDSGNAYSGSYDSSQDSYYEEENGTGGSGTYGQNDYSGGTAGGYNGQEYAGDGDAGEGSGTNPGATNSGTNPGTTDPGTTDSGTGNGAVDNSGNTDNSGAGTGNPGTGDNGGTGAAGTGSTDTGAGDGTMTGAAGTAA